MQYMRKIPTALGLFIIISCVAILFLAIYKFNFTNGKIETTTKNPIDVKNITYRINGEEFRLIDGKASKEIAPSSATKNTLTIFGEPIYGDLNNDGIHDAAILLVNNTGGSGMFYYAVLAIASGTTYISTNTLFLGDRIAPQTIEVRDGRAIFNYAERRATDSMTVPPSYGKSLFIYYDNATGNIGELVQNFEGEADPSRMSLTMGRWVWVKTQMNDGKTLIPKKINAFTITFGKDGRVAVTTDCNNIGGGYKTQGKTITFTQMMSTMMFCEDSQEQDFTRELYDVTDFTFTSKGELILEIKNNLGFMVFR